MLGRIGTVVLGAGLALAPVHAKAPVDPKAAIAARLAGQLRGGYTKFTRAQIRAEIKPADINGDGIGDWEVNFSQFGPAWCGTGGCRYQLWLGRKGAAPLLVFDRQMRELNVEHRSGRIVFVFDFHGSECGGFGAEACPGEFTWSAKRGRMILLPTPIRHTSMSNPIDRDL